MSKTLRQQIDDNGIMTVWFDQADRSANTFSTALFGELDSLVTQLENGNGSAPNGVIFTSGKPNVFVSGADLFEMVKMDGPQKQRFLEWGQRLFDRIAALPMPTVAALNGHCLGGGLEFALACNWRVAADNGSINIGLPETKLGIIPGWGGTTRMTRMIGPTRTLPMLLAGQTMPPRKAQRAGIVDEVVRPEALLTAARRLVGKSPPVRRPSRLGRLILGAPILCDQVCRKARRAASARTFGHYPAADALIDSVLVASREGHEVGLRAEREAVSRLVETEACRNLMRLFFLRHEAKQLARVQAGTGSSEVLVDHAAVIGGGTMGSGIVHALICGGVTVRLVEVDAKAISSALFRIDRLLASDVKAKRLSKLEARQALHRVAPTIGFENGLKMADLVVEAVAESMDVKQQVFAALDRLTRPDTVLASNTSSLSITKLAEMTGRPDRVIGLHFFNPVPKMPLVEVVRTPYSDHRSVAMGVGLGFRLGKTPVVVGDGPGFLVNRVLIPYLAEALVMASEGASIGQVDLAMKKWGMPMGPFELLDQVGLDVATHILYSLRDALSDKIEVPEGIGQVVDRGWLGRKSGRGFYEYGRQGRPRPNMAMAELLMSSDGSHHHRPVPGNLDSSAVAQRLVLPMVNEAAKLLGEAVIDSTDMIDLATVLGLGLAPFRGGLIRFAETTGLAEIVEQMDELAERHGPRFAPVASLRRVAQMGRPMQELAADPGCRSHGNGSVEPTVSPLELG